VIGGKGADQGDREREPMSREEFLSNLPERMITKGRVVNIRESILSKLDSSNTIEEGKDQAVVDNESSHGEQQQPQQLDVTIGRTPALSMLKRSATNGDLHVDREVTTLRIKMPPCLNIGGSLLLKMYFDDSISDLREHISQHLDNAMNGCSGIDKDGFDIRASYPSRLFRNEEMTLVDAGLTPNAALIVQLSHSTSKK
jgi:hypothetical protein